MPNIQITTSTTNILQKYDVDLNRGFLPSSDPLTKLPDDFKVWDNLASNFTAYINAGVIKEKILALPLIKKPSLNNQPALERAMLLLSCFAHAFIHDTEGEKVLPECISIPWDFVAGKLGRLPILSHASLVLNNWRRFDSNRPVRLDNITTLIQFHGGLDEAWFYLITTNMEQVGARGIPLLLEAMTACKEGDEEKAKQCLTQITEVLSELTSALKRMYEELDPHIFYKRIRPFLNSFENIIYKGCEPEIRNYHGGSAAQSSLLQAFDAGLGINYNNNLRTKNYLLLMRRHMPPKHAAFLSFLETESTISAFVKTNDRIKQIYQCTIDQLIELRNEHLKMVALYIVKEASKNKQDAMGTGGTNPLIFLKSIRNRNEEMKK